MGGVAATFWALSNVHVETDAQSYDQHVARAVLIHQPREKEKEVCTRNRGLPSILLPFRAVSRWTYGMRGLIYH